MDIDPIAFSPLEGAPWIDWSMSSALRAKFSSGIHAIKFSDGSVFDVINGWRKPPSENRSRNPIIDDLAKAAYEAYCEKAYGVEAVSYDDASSHQKSVATHQVLAVVRELLAILEAQASRTVR